jgi:hypothetical protein
MKINPPEPIDYRLRAASKRTDLPEDVIRLLADAYYEVWLGKERVKVLQDKNDSLLHTNEELEARNKNLKEGFEGGCHLCEVVAENSNRVRDSYNAAWAFNEELEKKNAELEQEAFALAANQCHAGYGGEYGHHRCKEIDRLTQERDEARREVCQMVSDADESSKPESIEQVANRRGWDCFKENS